ncbi:MAG: hypothetical protein HOP96_03675 [Sphingomonas sp.]|nr:hypothetical protein [Sphingomonas sp.]
MDRKRLLVMALGAVTISTAAVAGEVTGNGNKEDYSRGVSFCKFSGQNDDPNAPIDGPEGPGGRTQNWGHTQQIFDLDPSGFNPGEGCNPNSNPLPPELLNRP